MSCIGSISGWDDQSLIDSPVPSTPTGRRERTFFIAGIQVPELSNIFLGPGDQRKNIRAFEPLRQVVIGEVSFILEIDDENMKQGDVLLNPDVNDPRVLGQLRF